MYVAFIGSIELVHLETLFNMSVCEQPWLEQNLITENGVLRLESTRKVLQVLGRRL